mgnify:CR=1 FL=1
MLIKRNYVDIVLPTESADGYYMNKNKKLVDNFIYIDPDWYSQIFNPNTFYILGPKGCGKTLYAAYMCAEIRNNTISKSHTIDVSDYGKLIAMKTSNHLNFTEYLTMWKVILLQKLLLGLDATEIFFWGRSKNFKIIQDTVSEYFGYDVSDDSFNPITVIDSCGKQTEVTDFLNSQLDLSSSSPTKKGTFSYKNGSAQKLAQSSGKTVEKVVSNYTDTWLRAINAFKKTLEKISFKYNHFLFIDGLDVRPKNIDAKEYSECIGALVRAVYELNTKILGNMNRKDGHEFKIVALTRTDIFLNSDLVNVTSCIHDNCVELDWTYSNEKEFPNSKLYRMMNRILGWNGSDSSMLVNTYFAFKLPYPRERPLQADMYIQRLSRLRPRDIVVLLNLIQQECKVKKLPNPNSTVFDSPEFIANYSNYYTDQVKSEMMFNYSPSEIKNTFELIKTLKKDSFSEKEFEIIFNQYCTATPSFSSLFSTHRQLIDVLYSLDIIGWIESSKYHTKTHWHYREVKAIDESYRLPWEQFDNVRKAKLLIHKGASKHILGIAMR